MQLAIPQRPKPPVGSSQVADHQALAVRTKLADARRDPLTWWLVFYTVLGVFFP